MPEGKKVKRPHLGRGLESLLGPIHLLTTAVDGTEQDKGTELKFPVDKELRNSLSEIAIDRIRGNPYQPRSVWDEQELEGLAESIRVNGVIQPVLVRPMDGGYELIAGERRYRAAILAGLTVIPAMVRSASDEETLELALVENIQRTDLNPMERARAYQKFCQTFSLSQTEAAQRLGEDRSVVSNYLRLLELPAEIKDMLVDGRLSMGHARAILALPTDQLQRSLAGRAMAGRLSVRDVERLVRRYLQDSVKTDVQKRVKAAYIMDLERQLATALGTKVRIEQSRRGQRGRIIVDYYTLDEFERLTERMGLASADSA
jgi:ParB family chromosome partitioning protein